MMDNIDSKDGCFDVDVEKGVVSDRLGSSGGFIFGFIRMNQLSSEAMCRGGVGGCVPLNGSEGSENVNVVVVDKKAGEEMGVDSLGKKMVREKRKGMSAKKPPKPPRPPRGMSLDLADQKLIRELHELAKIKRARIERMKKKAKEAKASSSKNYQFATLLTVLFCVVFLFHGISSRTNSAGNSHAPVVSSIATEGSVISVQRYPTSSSGNLNRPMSKPSRFIGPISDHNTPDHANTEVG